jgi:hypothetical protein
MKTRNPKNLVKRYENLCELKNTVSDSYLGNSSFYMLSDGKYLNAESDGSYRAVDHRIIFGATKISAYDNHSFQKLQRNYQLIRIVPECETIMLDRKQKITSEQQKELDKLRFDIEYY